MRQIRLTTWRINSPKWTASEKDKKKLERLIAAKNELEIKITEGTLLDE